MIKVPTIISASLLAADFAHLEEEVTNMSEAGTDWFHIDVIDGNFVPNISMGAIVLGSLPPGKHLFDVHLMTDKPENHLSNFVSAGAHIITFHDEACSNPKALCKQIHSMGCKAGVALKPETPPETLKPYIAYCDIILIMTVEPGKGGQSFMHSQREKIRTVHHMINALPQKNKPLLSIDGGINQKTANLVLADGADVLVMGTALFHPPRKLSSYRVRIKAFHALKESRTEV